MAASVNGQEATQSILFNSGPSIIPHVRIEAPPKQATTGAKTTTTPPRWYNYGGQYEYNNWNGSSLTASNYGMEFPFLWFDTSSQDIYNDTPALNFNHLLSYGEVLQPWASVFNDAGIWGNGLLAVYPYNPYAVDSIEVVGIYQRNPATAVTIKDTLRISWVTGTGSGSTSGDIQMGLWPGPIASVPAGSTLYFLDVVHDSLNNVAKIANHQDIILGATDVMDTDAFYRGGSMGYIGLVHKRVAIPGGFAVPAGHFIAASATFKSGDSAAPHMPFGSANYGDTVFTGYAGSPYRPRCYCSLIVIDLKLKRVAFALPFFFLKGACALLKLYDKNHIFYR